MTDPKMVLYIITHLAVFMVFLEIQLCILKL